MADFTTFLDGRVRLFAGDCIEMMNRMEPDSVDCVVTSPPYWGLRDYGVEGQIGLEPTLAEHLEVMVAVFEAVRRVLKPTGTLWLNYGDCYATAPNGRSAAATKLAASDDRTFRDKPFSTVGPIYQPIKNPRGEFTVGDRQSMRENAGRIGAGGYLKPKDLCMIPNRLAIALQDAGWWVRSEIIWGKSNPMPDSSGAYRPATAHEKIFMLTKSGDGDVWRARDTGEISFFPDLSEMCALVTDADRQGPRWSRIGAHYDAGAVRIGRAGDEDANGFRGGSYVGGKPGARAAKGNRRVKMPDGWDTGPGGYGSHHRNGREKGKVLDKQRGHSRRHSRRHAGFNDRWDAMEKAEQQANGRYLRNYEPAQLTVWHMATQAFKEAHFATFPPELAERCILAGCPKGGLVLDPFGGAGTTALVALRHGRKADLIELNPEYAAIAQRRIEAQTGRLSGVCRKSRTHRRWPCLEVRCDRNDHNGKNHDARRGERAGCAGGALCRNSAAVFEAATRASGLASAGKKRTAAAGVFAAAGGTGGQRRGLSRPTPRRLPAGCAGKLSAAALRGLRAGHCRNPLGASGHSAESLAAPSGFRNAAALSRCCLDRNRPCFRPLRQRDIDNAGEDRAPARGGHGHDAARTAATGWAERCR